MNFNMYFEYTSICCMKVLELCNRYAKRYIGRIVCVYRLMMRQRGHAEKLLGNTKKIMP